MHQRRLPSLSPAYAMNAHRNPAPGSRPPGSLVEGRLSLHYAVQPLAAFAGTVAEAESGDYHRAMLFDPVARSFVTRGAHRRDGTRLELQGESLTLRRLDAHGAAVAELDLPGRTLDEAYRWSAECAGVEMERLVRPDYPIPPGPVGRGEPFPTPDDSVAEVLTWFAHAHDHLKGVRATEAGAGHELCWPHHFDLAVLTEPWGASDSRTVGVGLSPGDEMLPEPYWYVSPWPYPPPEGLQALSLGRWVTEGWVGALLPGSEALGPAGPDGAGSGGGMGRDADRRVERFLREAVAAARASLTR